jgi:hypothetical protein
MGSAPVSAPATRAAGVRLCGRSSTSRASGSPGSGADHPDAISRDKGFDHLDRIEARKDAFEEHVHAKDRGDYDHDRDCDPRRDAGKRGNDAELKGIAKRAQWPVTLLPFAVSPLNGPTRHDAAAPNPRRLTDWTGCPARDMVWSSFSPNRGGQEMPEDVLLQWRRVKDRLVGPTMLVNYPGNNRVEMLAQVGPKGGGAPYALQAYEYRHWLKRFLHLRRDEATYPMHLDTQPGPAPKWKSYASQPWLPAPGAIPGQVKWRYALGDTESGSLVVTTCGLATSDFELTAKLDPRVEASAAGLVDATVTIGNLGVHRATCKLHSIVDPALRVELLLPWDQGGTSRLADIVREYVATLPGDQREPEDRLEARMREAGLIAARPAGWEVYVEEPPSSMDEGAVTDLSVVGTSRSPGRALVAVRVTNSDMRAGLITDLVEFARE